jgi:glycosyltransferase involved in cell wall biosynthesis
VVLKTDGALSERSLSKAGFSQRVKDFFSYFFIDKIICENEYFYQKLVENQPQLRSKLVYIPNCPLEIYHSQTPVPFAGRPNDFLFVGRGDDPQKGLDILIEVWKKKQPFLGDWKLLVAGSCAVDLRNKWQQELADLDMADSVLWLGTFNPENLRITYNSAKVVVCPSRHDSGPIVLSEAILSGCAFICTEVGEVPIKIEGLPGLVKNETELGNVMLEFARNPSLAESQAMTLSCRMKKRSWDLQTRTLAEQINKKDV